MLKTDTPTPPLPALREHNHQPRTSTVLDDHRLR